MYEKEMINKAFDHAHGLGAVKANYTPPTHDPDTIEQLMAQVVTQSFEIKEALGNMRHQFLGSWAEPPQAAVNTVSPQGLIPSVKDALYKMLDAQREIREHIAAISKGVR